MPSSGFPENSGLQWDQFMVAYAVQVVVALVVLEAHEGPEVLEEFEGFEGVVEGFVEPEDLDLLMQ